MSALRQAMELLMTTFNKYAGKEGDKNTLTKAELIELLRNELPGAGDPNKAAVDDFFRMLDADRDGVVDFKEYASFVVILAMLYNQK